jgi:hypothetical protein
MRLLGRSEAHSLPLAGASSEEAYGCGYLSSVRAFEEQIPAVLESRTLSRAFEHHVTIFPRGLMDVRHRGHNTVLGQYITVV